MHWMSLWWSFRDLQWDLIGLANWVKRCQKVHRFHKRCQEVRGFTISYQILIKAPLCARKRGKLILPPGFFKTISVWHEVGSKKRKVQENDKNTQQVEGKMLSYFLTEWRNLNIFGSLVLCWTTLLVHIVEKNLTRKCDCWREGGRLTHNVNLLHCWDVLKMVLSICSQISKKKINILEKVLCMFPNIPQHSLNFQF